VTRLVLVRHGHAAGGWDDDLDPGLDDLGRAQFLGVAATAMRRILVDHARAKLTHKRGGGAQRVELGDVTAPLPDEQLLAVSDALERFAESKPDHAKLIELRYFGGLTGDEAAAALGVSAATADRMWRYARAWLQVELQK